MSVYQEERTGLSITAFALILAFAAGFSISASTRFDGTAAFDVDGTATFGFGTAGTFGFCGTAAFALGGCDAAVGVFDASARSCSCRSSANESKSDGSMGTMPVHWVTTSLL